MKKIAAEIFKDIALNDLGSIEDLKSQLDSFSEKNPQEGIVYFVDFLDSGGSKLSILERNEEGIIERIEVYEKSENISHIGYSKLDEDRGKYEPCKPEEIMGEEFGGVYEEVRINSDLEIPGNIIYLDREDKSEMQKSFEEVALEEFPLYQSFKRYIEAAKDKNGRKLSDDDISSFRKIMEFRE